MYTLKIISATDRPGSRALKVSNYLKSQYAEQGLDTEVISLENYPWSDVIGGSYNSDLPAVKAFNEPIINADGLLFVVPEYNGSFPGVLKVFIDYMPFPESLLHKPIAYVGEAAGAFGALRAVEQLQLILNYRNALNFPDRVFLQRVHNSFDEQEGPTEEATKKLMRTQIEGFSEFIKINSGK